MHALIFLFFSGHFKQPSQKILSVWLLRKIRRVKEVQSINCKCLGLSLPPQKLLSNQIEHNHDLWQQRKCTKSKEIFTSYLASLQFSQRPNQPAHNQNLKKKKKKEHKKSPLINKTNKVVLFSFIFSRTQRWKKKKGKINKREELRTVSDKVSFGSAESFFLFLLLRLRFPRSLSLSPAPRSPSLSALGFFLSFTSKWERSLRSLSLLSL